MTPTDLLLPSGALDRAALKTYTETALAAAGFPVPAVAEARPHVTGLRPAREIAGRALAIHALVAWVFRDLSADSIMRFCAEGRLDQAMSAGERSLLRDREAAQAHAATFGWNLESLWALLWVLGRVDDLQPLEQQFDEKRDEVALRHLPAIVQPGSVVGALTTLTPRPELEVLVMEDRYYRLHAAVRSAAAHPDRPPLWPPPFDLGYHGGIVAERRHALTWALSPGVHWEDIDLAS